MAETSTTSKDTSHGVIRLLPLVAVVALASLAHLLLPDVMGFDRSALEQYQWWRLLTAHTVHLNIPHTVMNVAALCLVLALVGDATTVRSWWLVYATIALVTSLALFLLDRELVRYVGASGVIHGLVAYGAVLRLGSHRLESGVLLVGLAAKLLYETQAGAISGSAALIGAPVITAAHFYGAIAGGALAASSLAWRRFSTRPSVT
ncbi:MAG: rhombosortase [Pseudomonadota bacterium]